VFFTDKEKEPDPEFVEAIENITAPAGRTVKLACSVQNLGSYRVSHPENHLDLYSNWHVQGERYGGKERKALFL